MGSCKSKAIQNQSYSESSDSSVDNDTAKKNDIVKNNVKKYDDNVADKYLRKAYEKKMAKRSFFGGKPAPESFSEFKWKLANASD